MRKYFSTLHQRSVHHKRRFALLTSGIVTLFIFGVWSLATFGTMGGGIVAGDKNIRQAAADAEVSPFQSLRMNLAASFSALKSNFGELKAGLETIDLEAEYREMKEGALDIYGQ